MKYLGIDYGDKRVGIAVSDPQGKIAFPRITLFHNVGLLKNLESMVDTEKISKIVVGLPIALNGSETEQSRKTHVFVEELKKVVAVPIEFENEIFTTHLVEKAGIKKEHTDESAAALILQLYLDKHDSRGT